MKEKGFLKSLDDLLSGLPAEQIEESKQFYAEAIADRIEDGMTEEEAVAAMGTPEAAAEAILDDLPVVPRAIAKTRRKSNILLWVLVIVGSPVWVPLLLAFIAVALTIYLCIWVLALCVWVVALSFAVVGVVSFALVPAGVAIGHIPYVLVMLGAGLALVGGALFVGIAAWAVSKQIARLSALWAKKAISPFWKSRRKKKDDEDIGIAANLAA